MLGVVELQWSHVWASAIIDLSVHERLENPAIFTTKYKLQTTQCREKQPFESMLVLAAWRESALIEKNDNINGMVNMPILKQT